MKLLKELPSSTLDMLLRSLDGDLKTEEIIGSSKTLMEKAGVKRDSPRLPLNKRNSILMSSPLLQFGLSHKLQKRPPARKMKTLTPIQMLTVKLKSCETINDSAKQKTIFLFK